MFCQDARYCDLVKRTRVLWIEPLNVQWYQKEVPKMAPKIREQSRGSRRSLSIKLLVSVVGVLCLGVAFMVITPIHAASQTDQPSAGQISGGGCTGGDLKVCIHAKNGQVVSEVFVRKSTSEPALVPFCPVSVTLKLFDNSGQIASTLIT